MDRQALGQIAAKHGIALIVRFGSTAVEGRMHAASDVDLAVLFERMPTLDQELDAAVDLQALVRDREVDIVVVNRADPLLLKQIVAVGQLEFGSAQRMDALKRYAFKRYEDHRRFLAMEREYLARKIAGRQR